MPDIHLLTNDISNLIAAGEVVERPASVVKELVENSIDAEATQITVEIVGGGLKKIKVSDNGFGMNAENAEKCFLKHATSKISGQNDLFAVKTLGFRGEAIPSIAAVSKIKLLTKDKDSFLGCEIINEGGRITKKNEIGLAEGTVFDVSQLFYNTPARLKFMKTEQTETGVIYSLVEKLAISHPEISFKFISNGNIKLFTPGNGKISDAIYAVYGKDFSSKLLQVNYEENGIQLKGYTGMPLMNKPNRNFQIFFVNGRLVKSVLLQRSLEICYKNSMLVGRYPCCILFLSLPFDEVDINVHPGKIEIKFADDAYVSNHVSKGISLALKKDTGIFEIEYKITELPKSFPLNTKSDFYADTKKNETSFNSFTPKSTAVDAVRNIEENKEDADPSTSDYAHFGNWEIIEKLTDDNKIYNNRISVASETVPLVEDSYIKNISKPESFPDKEILSGIKKEPSEDLTLFTKQEPVFRIIGEVFKTYIIIELKDEILLIDKHALHERMIFEKLKINTGVSSQLLITPYICNLGTNENALIVSHKTELEPLGFDISDFGTALMIREIPDIIQPEDVDYILAKASEHFKTNQKITEELFDELLYIIACKAAIKSGYKTSASELEILIKAYLSDREHLKYCPHGRPITVSFTEKFIQKQFKRII